jgi:hypothetical protein
MKTMKTDLLTENRYWTFWSSDWSKRINIKCNGETPFKKIVSEIKKKEGMKNCGYERQVELRTPDITFD